MKSFYDTATQILTKFFSKATLMKFGFNISPMYRRTTARITEVSEDIHRVRIRIPLSWRNKNYVGTIFGGSLFAATDPIYMIQLIYILGNDYVVWDKSTYIRFKRPANKDAFVDFIFTPEEIEKASRLMWLQREKLTL
jgi:acyl-coenzyme A thioesterase PaaI-like protein